MSNDVNKLTVVLEGNSEKLQKALKAANDSLTDFDKKTKKPKNGLNGILAMAKKLAPALSAAFAVREIGMFGKEAIMLGAKLEGIKNAFELIEVQGLTSLDTLKNATRGAVDEMTLMSLAVQAKNFKVPLENLGKFFEFATTRAAQTGESVEYLTRSIVIGIGRKSPLILDNLGITLVRLKEAMGKVGRESATVADISQAVAKIAEEEVGALTKLGLAATTTAQKLSKLDAGFKNYKASVGESINETGVFQGAIENVSKSQDLVNATRLLKNLREELDIKPKNTGGMMGFSGVEDVVGLENTLIEAKRLQKQIDELNSAARGTALTLFGDPKDAEDSLSWLTAASEQFEAMSNTGTKSMKRLALAIQTMADNRKKEENAEIKANETKIKFLDDYKLKLKEIEVQYQLGQIDLVQKATAENKLLDNAIVQMTMDVDGLGLAATKEYGDWNKLLSENGVLIEANAQKMRDMIALFKEMDTEEAFGGLSVEAANLEGLDEKELSDLRDRINAFMESNDLGVGDIFGSLLEDLENIEKKLLDISIAEIDLPINEFQELKKELLDIDRLSKENVLTEKSANEARLAALNKYIERLIEAGKIVPEIITKMRDSVATDGTDKEEEHKKEMARLAEASQMYSSISTALGQMASAFNPDSGIAKILRLAQSAAVAAAAVVALKTAMGDTKSSFKTIAAAASVAGALAGLVGNIGSVSGGFGGNGGGAGYNAALASGGQLYTDIRGRDLRILLDREGKFSDRRGG